MSAAEITRPAELDLDAWLAASRAASGVPRKVEEESALLDAAHRLLALAARPASGSADQQANGPDDA